jgi:copper chaperone
LEETTSLPSIQKRRFSMLTLKVSGMTCAHCAASVIKAVKGVPAVEDVVVHLERGEVQVKGNPNEQAVRDVIADEGYEVQAV